MTSKGKVLCFAPRSGAVPLADPCGLLCACRLLATCGYEIKIIQSAKGKEFTKEIAEEAKNAIAFGVSCITSGCILEAITATEIFAYHNVNSPIVWGGWHPSILPEQTLVSNKRIDAVVVGQGERAFLDLVETRCYREYWDVIPGVAFWRAGHLVRTEPRPLEDVNKFGPMPYHLIDVDRNLRTSRYGKRTARITSSQGCPHHCGFCVEPAVFGSRWSGRKPESVLDEIGSLIEQHGIDSVIFTDSNFFTDPRRVHLIAKGMVERGFGIKWGDCNGRTRQMLKMPAETWSVLSESGLKGILIGAESASEDAMELIQKECTVEETYRLVDKANSYGIDVVLSMMVGLPYPDMDYEQLRKQTEKEFNGALDLVDRVQQNGRGVWNHFLMFVYTPYPGTPLFDNAVKLGVRTPQTLAEWANFELNNQILPWVPKRIAFRAEMISTYIFFWLSGNPLALLSRNKGLYFVGLLVRILCKFRWEKKWFGFPVDFLAFRWASKRWWRG